MSVKLQKQWYDQESSFFFKKSSPKFLAFRIDGAVLLDHGNCRLECNFS